MPYAPGIQYTGDRYIYEAISGMGQNIAAGIHRYRQDKAENQAVVSAFETLVQSAAPLVQKGRLDPQVLEKIGDPSKFAGLSLSAKKAKLGQAATSFQMLLSEADKADRRRAEEELAAYRNATLGQQDESAKQRDRTRRETLSMLMRAIPGSSVAGGDPARQVELIQAIHENPNADPGAIADVLFRPEERVKTFDDMFPSAEQMLEPFEKSGKRGLYNRRTGQTLVDHPAEALAGTPIRDSEGNVISYAVPSGNRTVLVRDPQAVTTADRARLMEQRTRLLELRRDAELMKESDPSAVIRIDEDLAEIDRMMGRGGPARNAGGKQSPADQGDNAAPDRFKVGQRVTQRGVVYEFDGQTWKPAQ